MLSSSNGRRRLFSGAVKRERRDSAASYSSSVQDFSGIGDNEMGDPRVNCCAGVLITRKI